MPAASAARVTMANARAGRSRVTVFMSFMPSSGAKTVLRTNGSHPASARVQKGRATHAELCAVVLIGRVDRWSSWLVWRGGGGDTDRLGAVSDRRRPAADSPCHGAPHTDAVDWPRWLGDW